VARPTGLKSVLDSWAVLALLRDERSADRVQSAVERGALASWVNLGEAIYVEAPRVGFSVARSVIVRLAEIVRAEEPDAQLVQDAAGVKAEHRLSFADAFAVATAERHVLPLLTGDPEIIGLGRKSLRVVDLRG
jgi:PIN domain nuclease of toxin-antitoxin system